MRKNHLTSTRRASPGDRCSRGWPRVPPVSRSSGPACAQVPPPAATPLPSFTVLAPSLLERCQSVRQLSAEAARSFKLPTGASSSRRRVPLSDARSLPNAAFLRALSFGPHSECPRLSTWRLSLEGNVERPLHPRIRRAGEELQGVSIAAVNQCSGNSRSRFPAAVAGAQWATGDGDALWTGVPLRSCSPPPGSSRGRCSSNSRVSIRGPGPEGKGRAAWS